MIPYTGSKFVFLVPVQRVLFHEGPIANFAHKFSIYVKNAIVAQDRAPRQCNLTNFAVIPFFHRRILDERWRMLYHVIGRNNARSFILDVPFFLYNVCLVIFRFVWLFRITVFFIRNWKINRITICNFYKYISFNRTNGINLQSTHRRTWSCHSRQIESAEFGGDGKTTSCRFQIRVNSLDIAVSASAW